MVIVMAAGNEGKDVNKDGVIDPSSLLSPSLAKNCITVGASENKVLTGGIQKKWSELKNGNVRWGAEPIASDTPSDNENGIAAFSSRGPTTDGRIKPDLVAPGTNVLSARSHMPNASLLWGEYNEHYVWSGGTSMATPIVSGAATLVRQYYQEESKLSFVSAALIKATLINGADDLYPGQFGFAKIKEIETQRPNIHEGWGRVNLQKTLFPESRMVRFSDEAKGLGTGEMKEYGVEVDDISEPLRLTLVYSDFPAALQAKKALVNDLDLEIVSPAKKSYFPNGLKGPDRTNNVEHIDIEQPELGAYIIRVVGYQVPQGNAEKKQPYAVVMSGHLK